MNITLDIYELKNILTDAIELGTKRALIESGNLKTYCTKAEAYRMFGRRTIDRWILEELITPVKDGRDSSTVRLDRLKLEILAKSSNRATYLSVDERN